MAKRPSRSQADDVTAAEPPAQAKGRAKAQRELGPQAGANRPAEEDIRARAYQMYLERGGHHGLDFDDWLRAEQELKHGL